METSPPEGWTTSNYKTFNSDGQDSESDSDDDESDTDSEKSTVRGYKKEKYQKILMEEELLPE